MTDGPPTPARAAAVPASAAAGATVAGTTVGGMTVGSNVGGASAGDEELPERTPLAMTKNEVVQLLTRWRGTVAAAQREVEAFRAAFVPAVASEATATATQ